MSRNKPANSLPQQTSCISLLRSEGFSGVTPGFESASPAFAGEESRSMPAQAGICFTEARRLPH